MCAPLLVFEPAPWFTSFLMPHPYASAHNKVDFSTCAKQLVYTG